VAEGAHTGGSLALFAAFGPELAPLAVRVPSLAPLRETSRGVVHGVDVVARTVGVGLPAAAAGTARALADARPRAAVLIGTCGAYAGAPLAIGDVVVSRRIHLADALVFAGGAAFPGPMAASLDSDPWLARELAQAGARPVDVATTLAITVDDAAAARIALGAPASVEHLEAYGAAMACAAAGVPFAAVLAVANTVGSGARDEWRAHHERASEACVGFIVEWLGALKA
jgi:futalosine hydrolase